MTRWQLRATSRRVAVSAIVVALLSGLFVTGSAGGAQLCSVKPQGLLGGSSTVTLAQLRKAELTGEFPGNPDRWDDVRWPLTVVRREVVGRTADYLRFHDGGVEANVRVWGDLDVAGSNVERVDWGPATENYCDAGKSVGPAGSGEYLLLGEVGARTVVGVEASQMTALFGEPTEFDVDQDQVAAIVAQMEAQRPWYYAVRNVIFMIVAAVMLLPPTLIGRRLLRRNTDPA